jgi:hypothetical protein
MTQAERYVDWLGLEVYGPDDDPIGPITDLYDDGADPHSDVPAMATVRTSSGLLGIRTSYLPLRGIAEHVGDRVTVPYDREQVASSPDIAEGEELTADDARDIYRYYGLDETAAGPSDGVPREWRKVIRRQVVVTVVDEVDDVEVLAGIVPAEVPVEELQAAVASDTPTVIVIHEREIERLVASDDDAEPAPPPA